MDVLKLVPQLFLDLISRIVPGSVAIVVIAAATDLKLGKLATDMWDGAPALQDSALFLGFAFVTGAYLLGQIMSPVSDFLEKQVIKRIFSAYFQVLENAVVHKGEYLPVMQRFLQQEMGFEEETTHASITAKQYEQTVFVWYDWLRVNNPDAGARAAKIRAEYRMHSQNAVAFLVSLLLHLLLSLTQVINLKPELIVLLSMAGLASLWAMARTYRTFQWAVINQFYSAKASGDKKRTSGA